MCWKRSWQRKGNTSDMMNEGKKEPERVGNQSNGSYVSWHPLYRPKPGWMTDGQFQIPSSCSEASEEINDSSPTDPSSSSSPEEVVKKATLSWNLITHTHVWSRQALSHFSKLQKGWCCWRKVAKSSSSKPWWSRHWILVRRAIRYDDRTYLLNFFIITRGHPHGGGIVHSEVFLIFEIQLEELISVRAPTCISHSQLSKRPDTLSNDSHTTQSEEGESLPGHGQS